jgi:tetratricopeptide (TPR) repeat protein
VVDRAVQNSDRFYAGVLGYNFAAMPARYALERGAWIEAATLKLPVGASSYVQAITHFARAVGGARSGSVDQARADVDSLATIKSRLDATRDSYWSTIVDAQRLAASAWIALALRDTADALRLANDAAELEETVEKNPVTPGPILPARELEGDLLMQLGRHADALAAYDKTLTREPRRLRALYGAARAAQLSRNSATARKRYAELLTLMSKADPARPEPAVAKKYLAAK